MNGYYAASLDINPNTGMVVIAGKVFTLLLFFI